MKKIKRIMAVLFVAVAIMPISAQAEEMRYEYCRAIIYKDYKRKVVYTPIRSSILDYSHNVYLESNFRDYIK